MFSSFIRTVTVGFGIAPNLRGVFSGSWAVTTGEESHLALKIFYEYIIAPVYKFVNRKPEFIHNRLTV